MNPNDLPAAVAHQAHSADLLSPLLRGAASKRPEGAKDVAISVPSRIDGVVVGKLLAIVGDGQTPLVGFGETSAPAVPARTVVDLHGAHIGRDVVLQFEHGDPSRPIVLGVLRGAQGWPLEAPPVQVEVDGDGQRMLVNAGERLVLCCGKASITLTKAGLVLIDGTYVLSRASGTNRIKGGSVQLN